jgi:hypothetical protein
MGGRALSVNDVTDDSSVSALCAQAMAPRSGLPAVYPLGREPARAIYALPGDRLSRTGLRLAGDAGHHAEELGCPSDDLAGAAPANRWRTRQGASVAQRTAL